MLPGIQTNIWPTVRRLLIVLLMSEKKSHELISRVDCLLRGYENASMLCTKLLLPRLRPFLDLRHHYYISF
jgi:hypothetical protein